MLLIIQMNYLISPQNEVIENHNCTHIVSSDFLLWLSGIFLVPKLYEA